MSQPIAIGMCLDPERAGALAPGYDYLELSVSSTLIPLEDDDVYAARRPQLVALKPGIRAFNLFVPSQVKLVGPVVNWHLVSLYVERALRRAGELGGKIVVFGSGGARELPEGYSREVAWRQLVRFLHICASHARIQGITIAIEPICHLETNFIHTYLEAVQLAKDVNRESVRVLADIYHFVVEDEPLADIAKEPGWLAHVHLADSGRLYPGSGSYPLERLFAILKDIGYQGGASVECSWGDDFTGESARALEFLRKLAG